jgi:mevalonate kinase
MKKNFSANGKVLLTAEYLVLEGAEALALPTKKGQSLLVNENSSSDIQWHSLDSNGDSWFSAKFSLYDFKAVETTDVPVSNRITQLLKACARQDSEFLSQWKGQKIETKLEFDKSWGLGSSSTLVYCIAKWADVNPFQLLMDTFGGSGYDVACASADGPIIYSIIDYAISVQESSFAPTFSKNLYFIYLGRKQNSQEAVKKFNQEKRFTALDIDTVNGLTEAIEDSKSLSDFQKLIKEHELLIGKTINQKPVKEEFFSDFEGETKSLGAWGGDLILVASGQDDKAIKTYFENKGLNTIIPFDELILKRK